MSYQQSSIRVYQQKRMNTTCSPFTEDDFTKDDDGWLACFLRTGSNLHFALIVLIVLSVTGGWGKVLHAGEFKLHLGTAIDTAFTLTVGERINSQTPATPQLGDLSVPINFLYYMDFKYSFDDNHRLLLSWEVDFDNRLARRFDQADHWETTLTGNRFGERELSNMLAFAYTAQPYPFIWIKPSLAYNVLVTTHDEVFSLTESIFTYHAYHIGFQLGLHQNNEYITNLRQRNLSGWSGMLSLSYGDYYFTTNNYQPSTITFTSNSISAANPTPTANFDPQTLKNFLNYKDFVVDLMAEVNKRNFQWRIGYKTKIFFVANELVLNKAYFSTTDPSTLFTTTPNTHSQQSISTSFTGAFARRKEETQGSSGMYWNKWALTYKFAADLYQNDAYTIGYANAPSLFQFINPIANFKIANHDLALYSRHDQEKYLHRLALDPRINFLSDVALLLHYSWSLIDYKNYIPQQKLTQPASPPSTKNRLDQIHALRIGFKVLRFSKAHVVEPYVAFNFILANDDTRALVKENYSFGLLYTYDF
ncbi:hypothetical protein COTS27_01132 [Spirochaetota bacterium]|nr:hypothetical protein COTS27_01132 [Spirochaetota bacterium]